MTPLRQRMIDGMRLAGFAERTRDVYIQAVRRLAAHYIRSPDVLSEEEVVSTERHYETTSIPTLRHFDGTPADREILLKLYEQTCTTWRMLVDVRFKLFALVPTASLISLATIFGATDPQKQMHPRSLFAFAVLGLIVTVGVLIYDFRNSQLHDDLISRGRKIEDELGAHTAVFRGRKNPPSGFVNHSTATALIYGSAILAWIVGLIWTAGRVWPRLVF